MIKNIKIFEINKRSVIAFLLVISLTLPHTLKFLIDIYALEGLRDNNTGYVLDFESYASIERIKDAGTLNVLEIIPNNASRGSMGFYMVGREELFSTEDINNIGSQPNFATRQSVFEGIINNYSNVISTGTNNNTHPIHFNGYEELYPWQNDSVTTNHIKISLSASEDQLFTVGQNLSFAFREEQNGEYLLEDDISLVTNADEGTIKQKYQYLVSGVSSDDGAENVYYYNPTFTSIYSLVSAIDGDTTDIIDVEDVQTFTNNNFGINIYENDGSNNVFVDNLGQGYAIELKDFSVAGSTEQMENAYVITDVSAPSTSHNADTAPYYAIHEAYLEISESATNTSGSYFKQSNLTYIYVGSGNGDYSNYETNYENATEFTVRYNEVYIKGVENNNWFFKYALDGNESETVTNINLTTQTTANVTQNSIDNADIIILSEGYKTGSFNSGDISDISAFLDVAKDNLKPILISDKMSAAWSAQALEVDLVAKNVLVYKTNAEDITNSSTIISSGFKEGLNNDIMEEGFRNNILNEIIRENVHRSLTGTLELPIEMSFGTAIRHLLNSAHIRVETDKTDINVLEIQAIYNPTDEKWIPNSSSYIGLKTSTVAKWMGVTDEEMDDYNITVTTMSVAEFIGKNEDIFEVYDLVYIGGSTYGFNTRVDGGETITNYNDNTMDGLIYTNIGDTFKQENSTYGLIDSEYYLEGVQYSIEGNGISYMGWPLKHDGAVDTRFSGNDITPAKLAELQAFAQAGFPIIIDDNLISAVTGVESVAAQEVDIKINYNFDDNNTTTNIDDIHQLLVSQPLITDYYPLSISYQWQVMDVDGNFTDIAGANSPNLTVEVTTATYRCEIAVAKDGVVVDTEYSNVIALDLSALSPSYFDNSGNQEDGLVTQSEYSFELEYGYKNLKDGYYYTVADLDNGYIEAGDTVDYNWYFIPINQHSPVGKNPRQELVGTNVYFTEGGQEHSIIYVRKDTGAVKTASEYNEISDGGERGKYVGFNLTFNSDNIIDQNEFIALDAAQQATYTTVQVGYVNQTKFYTISEAVPISANKYVITYDSLDSVNRTSTMYVDPNPINSEIPIFLTQAVVSNGIDTDYYASKRWCIKKGTDGSAPTTGQTENNSSNTATSDENLYTSFDYYNVQLDHEITADNKFVFKATPTTTNQAATIESVEWYTRDKLNAHIPLTTGVQSSENGVYKITLNELPENPKVSYVVTYDVGGTKIAVRSAEVTFQVNFTTSDDANYGTLQIPAYTYEYDVLDTHRVDNSSNMWETFMGDPRDVDRSEIMSKPNVLSVSEIAKLNTDGAQNGLKLYLNLSKPMLNLITAPIEYGSAEHFAFLGVSSTTDVATLLSKDLVDLDFTDTTDDNTLVFEFELTNPTDPTPVDTKYEVNVYIEADGDGRFSEREEISDIIVEEKLLTGEYVRIDERELSAAKTYRVTKKLPENVYGGLTWNLEVVKVGVSSVTASQTGITYNKPIEPLRIEVLQIYETSKLMRVEYKSDFDKLRNAGVYDIVVNEIHPDEIHRGEFIDLNPSDAKVIDNAYDFFDQFDILFLGFQDSFGAYSINNGMSLESAEALQKYIESGKAIVFTQDTISTEHIPISDYPHVNSAGVRQYTSLFAEQWFSGYYFNNVIRSVVGMDKYGVVSEEYGLSQYSYFGTLEEYEDGKRYVTSGYAGVDMSKSNAIEADGYAVAYEPGSGRTAYVEETHGFTTFMTTLKTYDHSALTQTVAPYLNHGGFHYTNEISQVNKGQLTSFPYNVNTTFYNTGSGSNYHIMDNSSNNQYTQVNLYDEDVTVWFTLADSGINNNYTGSDVFKYHYNDAANAFYIYSKGNITYTGAGNNNKVPTGVEKNIFINSMITSYRPVEKPPEFTFTEGATGIYITSNLDFVAGAGEFDKIDINSLSEDERKIYFYVENETLTQRDLDLTLYYDSNDDGVLDSTDSYLKTFKDEVGNEQSLIRNYEVYYFDLTQDMLDKLAASDDFSLDIQAVIDTTVNGEAITVKSIIMPIHIMGYLPLT